MMMTDKDTDLREALRRKYADTPQLPDDFSQRLMQRVAQQEKKSRRLRHLWPLTAAVAACLLLLLTINHNDDFDVKQNERPVTAQQAKLQPVMEQEQNPRTLCDVTAAEEQTPPPHVEATQKQPEQKPQAPRQATTAAPAKKQTVSAPADDNLHYAAHESVDTTYQPPSHMEEFIVKMANYHHVDGESLECTSDMNDSTIACTVYVFDDNEELNLFNRLLLAACWYDCKTPGYLLNFSYKQFFFCLKDMRLGLKYLWIAERLRGKILLYSTHSPIDAEVSSECYQNYRDNFTHTNINTKTSEL